MMTYEEALSYLQELNKFGYNFGLGRITQLLKMLGNPQQNLKVIHIGGTNGKGSTAAMVVSILKSAGFRVGLFSSPHLHNYTERMTINGEEIPQGRMASLLTEIRFVLVEMVEQGFEHPTEFEVNTALALLYFAREQVDFTILEVGLGGAIDSTNVVQPLVAAITNVGMDHMEYLGENLKDIAKVKAGIIKAGSKVVTGVGQPEILEILEKACQENKVELIKVGQDILIELLSSTVKGVSFNLQVQNMNYEGLEISLLGEHQTVNGALAVAIVKFLSDYGYQISSAAIRQGLKRVSWPGRLEILRHRPAIVIDVAHNVDGAQALRKAIESIFSYRKLVLVLGMLADKDKEKILKLLAPLAEILIVTQPNSPRAGSWKDLAKIGAKYVEQVEVIPKIEDAIQRGLELAGVEDLLCITGSIYMVADARKMIMSI